MVISGRFLTFIYDDSSFSSSSSSKYGHFSEMYFRMSEFRNESPKLLFLIEEKYRYFMFSSTLFNHFQPFSTFFIPFHPLFNSFHCFQLYLTVFYCINGRGGTAPWFSLQQALYHDFL